MSEITFLDKPEVLVALTYDSENRPLVLARGKKRFRDADMEAIKTWLRALQAQIQGEAIDR